MSKKYRNNVLKICNMYLKTEMIYEKYVMFCIVTAEAGQGI
jgi:hypothetical protein